MGLGPANWHAAGQFEHEYGRAGFGRPGDFDQRSGQVTPRQIHCRRVPFLNLNLNPNLNLLNKAGD